MTKVIKLKVALVYAEDESEDYRPLNEDTLTSLGEESKGNVQWVLAEDPGLLSSFEIIPESSKVGEAYPEWEVSNERTQANANVKEGTYAYNINFELSDTKGHIDPRIQFP